MKIYRTQEGSETWNSLGNTKEKEIKYFVSNPTSKHDAMKAVMEDAPSSYGNLPRASIRFDSYDADGNIEISVTYSKESNDTATNDDDNTEPESTMNFECSSGTAHVIKARQQEIKYGNIDAGGFIGWHGPGADVDVIDGVDIVSATMRVTFTKTMSVSKLTTSYCRKIAELTGTVNNSDFKGWKIGEVLFLGASYSAAEGDTKTQVSFNFAIQPTEEITIAGKTIRKYGHDVFTTITKKVKNVDGAPTVKIVAAHLSRVYKFMDFKQLGL